MQAGPRAQRSPSGHEPERSRALPPGVRIALLAVAVVGAGALVHGFATNTPGTFHGGGLVFGVALAAWTVGRGDARGRRFTSAVLIGLASFFPLLGLLELALAPEGDDDAAIAVEPAYSFRDARGDPAAFEAWWKAYMGEWFRVNQALQMRDPTGLASFVPRPGGRARIFDSSLEFNSRGFRGPEFDVDKGGAYRIVALGESTTMGATIRAHDEPWPSMLERRLNAALAADDRTAGLAVEVLNAGFGGWNLKHSLRRLREEVLALDPDMLISYHGFNGFKYLNVERAFAPVTARERPSRLLSALERRWRRRFDRDPAPPSLEPTAAELAATPSSEYARLYRDLIELARERDVELVLLTFNMAVDRTSPREVIEFYRSGFRDVEARIVANDLHNRWLRSLPAAGGLTVVDSGPELDGRWDADLFIDLVHFTNAGRERLTDAMFAAVVERVRASARARPRPQRDADEKQ